MSGTEVLPEQETRIHEDVRPDTSHGDHERFAHYVDKSKIVDSMVTGTPVTALCGKVWVPSRQDVEDPLLQQVREPSVEEERLASLYVNKGLPALIEELQKY